MFSYYGSKLKIVKHYPKPRYKTIIEPFCGAAWYSILNESNKVILSDKNKIIFEIWNWLINEATQEDIIKYSEFNLGDDISNLDIQTAHKNLIGFCINRGSVQPCNIVQKWSCQSNKNPLFASTVKYQLDRCARLIDKVSDWEIFCKSYEDLPNIEATWFIDPPYQVGGNLYKESNIDYKKLEEWCKTRKGQVIVCENSSADWMDFKPLVNITGQRKKSTEVIWTND